MNKAFFIYSALATSALTAFPVSQALAQTSESAAPQAADEEEQISLGDIVVTARKREESLMQVPIAVTALSNTAIESSGVKNLQNLAQFTPGLFSQTGSATGRADRSIVSLTFRGLSTSSGSIFIDGAPYVASPNTGIGTPDVTDVERVEVLKGPQSVYFGRATFSGAVNYVTRAPGNEFAGRVSADVYTYGGSDVRLMLEGPIVPDVLSVRVAGRRYQFDGQYHSGINPEHKLGSQSTTSGSVALSFTPSSNFKALAYYSYALDEDGPAESTTLKQNGTGPKLTCNLGGTGGFYWCGEIPRLSQLDQRNIGNNDYMTPLLLSEIVNNARGYPVPFRSNWLDHFGLKREVHHAHLKLDYTTDSGWQVASLFSFSQTKFMQILGLEGLDTSQTPNPFYITDPVARAAACAAVPPGPTGTNACFAPATLTLVTTPRNLPRVYTAEGRVSSPDDKPLRATVGASYFRLGGPPQASFGVQNSGRLANAGGGGLIYHVKTPAVFGGVYFDATDQLTVSAEARYQWDKIENQNIFPTVSAVLTKTFRSFSPRVTIDYKPTSDSLIYASFSRGYRPGGFNAGILSLTPAQRAEIGDLLAYKQERLDNFELGYKAAWFGNHLRTRLALYRMNWGDGQVNQTYRFTSGNTTTVVSNVGKVHLTGVEFEADLAVTPELRFSGNLNYARNKIIDYVYLPNGPRIWNSTDVSGNDLDRSPRFKGSVSAMYDRPISSDVDIFARADVFFQSKFYVDPTNVAWVGGNTKVNARIGFKKSEKLKVEFYVNNLFNDDHMSEAAKANDSIYGPGAGGVTSTPVVSSGVSALNGIFLGLPVKRTFGARVSYDF